MKSSCTDVHTVPSGSSPILVPISMSAQASEISPKLPWPIQVTAASRRSLIDGSRPLRMAASVSARRMASITSADDAVYPFLR